MSKSMIYAVNTGSQTVAAGGTVVLDTIVRKSGNSINLSGGNAVTTEAGFYSVVANVTVNPVAAAPVTASVLVNGTAVPGASATFTPAAANDAGSLSIPCVIRTYGCCMAEPSVISLSLSAQCAVKNAAIEVIH